MAGVMVIVVAVARWEAGLAVGEGVAATAVIAIGKGVAEEAGVSKVDGVFQVVSSDGSRREGRLEERTATDSAGDVGSNKRGSEEDAGSGRVVAVAPSLVTLLPAERAGAGKTFSSVKSWMTEGVATYSNFGL